MRDAGLTMRRPTNKNRGGRSNWKVLVAVVLALYLTGGVAFGFIFLRQVESLFAVDLFSGAGRFVSTLPGNLGIPSGSPASAPLPENSRVNVLLLGIDQRPEEKRLKEPARTDTVLLATIEPSSKTAGMVSIPRDLWVSIPQGGPGQKGSEIADRINTANFWGDAWKIPGGGPALAKRTIEYNFGVKVHYYAKVDFSGFKKAVDTFGGVTVNVPKTIIDEEYPDDYGDGVQTIIFRPGRQHMDGARALQYVRTRHADNDFGRAERQRQVLMALREQIISLDGITKLPALLGVLGDSFETDIPAGELLRLGNIVRSIDSSQIAVKAIDLSLTTPTVTSGGADVLVPNRSAIAKVIGEMFFDPNLKQENASIEVLNGTQKAGLAGSVADALVERGFNVTRVDNADRADYSQTVVRYYDDKPYSVRSLSSLLNVPMDKISLSAAPDRPADVTIIVGQDARVP
ncbi:MAG: LytR family transcriptional regulator [Chloroflexota bacterium]|nr:MAG: LytR family transcriptional regulator [Chloroflexota bacterium]